MNVAVLLNNAYATQSSILRLVNGNTNQRDNILTIRAMQTATDKRYWVKYKRNNREKVRHSARTYYWRNREKILGKSRLFNTTSKGRYEMCKKRAKKRGYEFDISLDFFAHITSKPCHYCGATNVKIGIDRKDSSKGYVPDNCVPCCRECNIFKLSKNYERFVRMCIKIGKHMDN